MNNLKTRAEKVIMNTYPFNDLEIVRGEGCYLFDADGRKYLDLMGGIAVNSLGHAHPAYIEAAIDQIRKVNHLPGPYMPEPKVRCAELLVEHSCFDQVFFCNSGTEANEAALKLARKWAVETKGPHCTEIICFEGAFHGRTMGALSVTGKHEINKAFQPLIPGVHFAAFNDIESVKALVNENTSTIILEPIQGEGGVHPASVAFLQDLRDLCDAFDIALIYDEIQCGMGRTGHLFAYEHFGVEPDIVSLAKGLGNGFPIGATLAKGKFSKHFDYGSHGSTFGGGPLATRLACVVLETMLSPGFLENVKVTGTHFRNGLNALGEDFACVGDVRGEGLMIGMDVTCDFKELSARLRENGLLTWKSGTQTFRFLPPLILSQKETDEALNILRKTLK